MTNFLIGHVLSSQGHGVVGSQGHMLISHVMYEWQRGLFFFFFFFFFFLVVKPFIVHNRKAIRHTLYATELSYSVRNRLSLMS